MAGDDLPGDLAQTVATVGTEARACDAPLPTDPSGVRKAIHLDRAALADLFALGRAAGLTAENAIQLAVSAFTSTR